MWLEIHERSFLAASVQLILSTFIIIYITYYFYKRQKKINAFNLLPGPRALPIIGNVLDYYGPPTEHIKAIQKNICIYPCGLSRTWIGSTPRCTLYKASKVEAILISQKYTEKSSDYEALQPWLGLGLITLNGTKWQQRRKMLTPTFHFKILEDFIDIFNQQSSKFVSILQENANGASFDIFTPIKLCTLDIILESAMGRSIDAQGNSNSDYVQAVNKIGTLVVHRLFRPWLRPNFLFKIFGYAEEHDKSLKIIHDLSTKTIKERRDDYYRSQKKWNSGNEEQKVSNKRKRLAFLDLLLESENGEYPLSDEDIRAEVDTFMFAGHDTTATSLNWTIYLLGCYPEIQKKLCEELDSMFGDSDRPATTDDLREMKYLECCIKEALRIFPPAPGIGRDLHEDVTVDGYTIPSGTRVFINQYMLHRDPEYFPDPEDFKPERFFPENCATRHPFAYVPFSAGPRNCIGQKFAMLEDKVVLSWLFRKFRVESTEKREDLKITAGIILRPETGTMVKIYSRKSN